MSAQAPQPSTCPVLDLECSTKSKLRSLSKVAFKGFDNPRYWVNLALYPPSASMGAITGEDKDFSEVYLKLDSRLQHVWIKNADLVKCFFNEVSKVLRHFPTPLCHRVKGLIKWCYSNTDKTLWKEETKKIVLLSQKHFKDKTLSKLTRTEHKTARTMIVGKNQAYLLFTRNRACGDPIIGKGTTKRVKFAISLSKAEICAVSISRTEHYSLSSRPSIKHEIALLKHCRGMYGIVQLYANLIEKGGKIYSIMEHGNIGSLHDAFYNTKRSNLFSISNKLKIAKDITVGVLNLHSSGIIHQDFKPPNVLLIETHNGILAKICDLGSAIRQSTDERVPKKKKEEKKLNTSYSVTFSEQVGIRDEKGKDSYEKINEGKKTVCLADLEYESFCNREKIDLEGLKKKKFPSPGYLSPECIEGFNEKSTSQRWIATQKPAKDIWALGVTFFELFHPRPGTRIAFQEVSPSSKMLEGIKTLSDLNIISQIEVTGIPWQIQFIIAGMLSVDPDQRSKPIKILSGLNNVSEEEL